MLDFLLRLKHWQLFLLIGLPTIASQFIGSALQPAMQEWQREVALSDGAFTMMSWSEIMEEYGTYIWLFGIIFLVSFVVQYGWYYAVLERLGDRVPQGTPLNRTAARIAFWAMVITSIVFSYFIFSFVTEMLGIVGSAAEPDEQFFSNFLAMFGVIFGGGLLLLVAFVYIMYHIGKILKSIELGRPARGSEAVGYAFLSYLLIIGCWILQPKINRFLTTGAMEKPEDAAQVW